MGNLAQAMLLVDESVLRRSGEELVVSLPADWRRLEQPMLREVGAEWVASRDSVAMRVPSVVIEG